MELDSYLTSLIIPESVLTQKYLENRLSISEISQEFSCSKTYVRSLLLKYNIPLHKQSERRGSRWYVYGRRKVNGKTIDHKGEQRAIARCLDTMKIPTKQKGKGWHSNTIIKILRREGVYVERRKGRVGVAG